MGKRSNGTRGTNSDTASIRRRTSIGGDMDLHRGQQDDTDNKSLPKKQTKSKRTWKSTSKKKR